MHSVNHIQVLFQAGMPPFDQRIWIILVTFSLESAPNV